MIETERLILRLPRLEDASEILDAVADPEAMRYIGDGSTTDLAGAERAIARWLERWDAWGVGLFVLERRVDGRVLGRAGLSRWDPETWEAGGSETEIGWGLAREHWGAGYATEAALAIRDWSVLEYDLSRLISLIQPGNVRSVRVAEKIGQTLEREVVVSGRPTLLYSMAL